MSAWHAVDSETLETYRTINLWVFRLGWEFDNSPDEEQEIRAAEADRISDVLQRRRECEASDTLPWACLALRGRMPDTEREKRGGCAFPLCSLPGATRYPHGHRRFKDTR